MYIFKTTSDVTFRRNCQLVAETHRRVARVALRLQAPVRALYAGSVVQRRWTDGETFGIVVPGRVQYVVTRSTADRFRASRTLVA